MCVSSTSQGGIANVFAMKFYSLIGYKNLVITNRVMFRIKLLKAEGLLYTI